MRGIASIAGTRITHMKGCEYTSFVRVRMPRPPKPPQWTSQPGGVDLSPARSGGGGSGIKDHSCHHMMEFHYYFELLQKYTNKKYTCWTPTVDHPPWYNCIFFFRSILKRGEHKTGIFTHLKILTRPWCECLHCLRVKECWRRRWRGVAGECPLAREVIKWWFACSVSFTWCSN